VKKLAIVGLLLVSCSSGPRKATSLESAPERPDPSGEHGSYRKPLALISYETLNRHLGYESTLTTPEKEAFWKTIHGMDIVWTGIIDEIGEPREMAVPVKFRVGRQSTDWDTIVFFDPEHYQKLKWYRPGDTITFRGSVEKYELTTVGVQITIARGRFASEPSPAGS
jgi:hypothetical protein